MTFYQAPTIVDRCGGFLFIGGHPSFSNCTACSFNTVDAFEKNDISLTYVRDSSRDYFENFRPKESIKKGEIVYLIHSPYLKWIDSAHPLRKTSPLITKAKVLDSGRDLPIVALSGIVSNGSSGGIAVDENGKLLGVLSAGISSEGISILQPLSNAMIKKIEKAKDFDGYWQ